MVLEHSKYLDIVGSNMCMLPDIANTHESPMKVYEF